SVECCARLDAVMAGQTWQKAPNADLRGRRFVVPTNYMMDELSPGVAEAFTNSLRLLRDSGAQIVEAPMPALEATPDRMETGGISAAESYYVHRHWLQQYGDQYDRRVRLRIEVGAGISAADYLELLHSRAVRKQQA